VREVEHRLNAGIGDPVENSPALPPRLDEAAPAKAGEVVGDLRLRRRPTSSPTLSSSSSRRSSRIRSRLLMYRAPPSPRDPAGSSHRDAEDELERAVGPRPVLADEWLASATEEAPQDERDDHDIIELAGDGDEVRHDVEGEREVAGERDEQRLLAARHAWVTEQAAAEDNAVGDEASERTGALAPTGDDEREDERGVEEEEGADSDDRPRQDVHPTRLAAYTHAMAIDAIRAAYDALGTGDVEPLVSLMDEGMEWHGRRRGWRFWRPPPS
jgi:hypothetical protein